VLHSEMYNLTSWKKNYLQCCYSSSANTACRRWAAAAAAASCCSCWSQPLARVYAEL